MPCFNKSKKFDSVIGVIREKEKQPLRKLYGSGKNSDVKICNNWHTVCWKKLLLFSKQYEFEITCQVMYVVVQIVHLVFLIISKYIDDYQKLLIFAWHICHILNNVFV